MQGFPGFNAAFLVATMSLICSAWTAALETDPLSLQDLKQQAKTVSAEAVSTCFGGQPVNLDLFSNQLLYSTVRIEAAQPDGTQARGTGFLFAVKDDAGREIPLLMTNNHVIDGSVSVAFRLHKRKGKVPLDESFGITIPNSGALWIKHPRQEIDLCAMPLGPMINHFDGQGVSLFSALITPEIILSDGQLGDLQAVEDVVMVGYPIALSDNVNNFPLFRKGITSTHPAVNFQGRSETVIDTACFPGSSGSPVFILNQGAYPTAKGLTVGNRIVFLGVLYAGPVYDARGKLQVLNIPTSVSASVQTLIPANLGYIIKAKEVLELANHIKRLATPPPK